MPFTVLADITQPKIDVSDILVVTMRKHPVLNLFPWSNTRQQGINTRRFEWTNEARTEPTLQLTSDYSTGAGSLTVASTTGASVGDIIHIAKHRDSSFRAVKFRVTAIPDATTLTVAIAEGTDTAYAIGSTGDGTIHVTHGILDAADAGTGRVNEPTLSFNFFQTFEKNIEVGQKAQASSLAGMIKGIPDALMKGIEQRASDLAWDIDNAVWNGVGLPEAPPQPAMMRGIDSFVVNGHPSPVDGGAAELDEVMLNEAAQYLFVNGVPLGEQLALVCSPPVARKISQIRKENTRFQSEPTPQQVLGGAVQVYLAELGGYSVRIVAHPNFDSNNVSYLLAPRWIEFVAPMVVLADGTISPPIIPASQDGSIIPTDMGVAWMIDSTPPGRHSKRFTLRAELSLRVHHAHFYHIPIVNFTL